MFGLSWFHGMAALAIAALASGATYKIEELRIDKLKSTFNDALAESKEAESKAHISNLEKITKAQNEAAKTRQKLHANARTASTELEWLRGALRYNTPGESNSTKLQRADTTAKLFAECGAEATELARAADGHAADKIMILDAWPK